jgi:hypothetical protein
MALIPIPEINQEVRLLLKRTEWRDFPDVIIHAEESLIKKHPLYPLAKSGNPEAALGLALQTTSLNALDQISALLGNQRPLLLPVQALETAGLNIIPRMLAKVLATLLDLPVATGIVQINRVNHTGADGYSRLAFPALFDGPVLHDSYFLMDDFIGQGGTLANLKGWLESAGATVTGATTLTGKAYSARLGLTRETLQNVREKYGNELEQWWLTTFGYSFACLTESEARYLLRADDADTIANRIAQARRTRN